MLVALCIQVSDLIKLPFSFVAMGMAPIITDLDVLCVRKLAAPLICSRSIVWKRYITRFCRTAQLHKCNWVDRPLLVCRGTCHFRAPKDIVGHLARHQAACRCSASCKSAKRQINADPNQIRTVRVPLTHHTTTIPIHFNLFRPVLIGLN